jgi:hypothetical protein
MELPVFPWRIWCLTALIAATFFSFTLTSAVPVWIDESMIVEYGRVTLAGEQPVFSFHQRSDSLRPMYSYALLGCVLEEIAYRATAPSNLGPRLMALIGQLAAFGLLIYYLRLYGLNTKFSVLLGLAFLMDPLCDIGWRGGRLDEWAFAFLFAALSAIRVARARSDGDRGASLGAWLGLFLGGAAASAGFLCWSSFAMFAPLIVFEFGALVREQRRFLIPMGVFSAGGALVAAVIIAPFHREFVYGLADAGLLTLMQSHMTRADGIGVQVRALVISFAQTPIVVAAGLCALAKRRNRLLLTGFLVALVFIFETKVYRLRVLYVLPYLYLAVASLFCQDDDRPARFPLRKVAVWVLSLMLFSGFGFTVAGTTLSGLSNRSGKDPLALIEPARSAVGSGPIRVYMTEPDLYFAGRALGWQQLFCFDGCWGPGLLTQNFHGFPEMDVAIFRDQPDDTTRASIEKLGFRFRAVILPEGGHQSSLFGWSYGPRSYGPYFVYRRPPK